jgi:transcriptional regulator with XRE-family HTH domain
LTGIYSERPFDFKASKRDNERMARMTNEEFGDKVGCHYSMASRLRNGERLPSRDLLRRIISAFKLDRAEAYEAYDQGREAFSQYLRDAVFEPSKPGTTETNQGRER